MDIRKLVEEEMRKVLKEDEAAPKEVVFKNPEQNKMAACKKEGEIPRGTIGIVCKQKADGTGLAKTAMAGFQWVDNAGESQNMDVKTSDPTIIKKYTYIQQVRIAQQIYNSISKITGTPTQTIKRVGDIQGAVDLLRKYFPLVGSKVPFPSKQNYGNLTTRLQAILTVISKNPDTVKKAYEQATSEVAKEKEAAGQGVQPATGTVAQPATAPQESPSGYGSKQEPIEFDEFEKLSPKNKANRIVYYSKGDYMYGAKFNADGTSYTLIGRFPKPLEESKLIRKMIVQEVRKALTK